MFLDLNEYPEKVEGVGQLLFEMCKGVRNMFHSCTGQVKRGQMPGVCAGGINRREQHNGGGGGRGSTTRRVSGLIMWTLGAFTCKIALVFSALRT